MPMNYGQPNASGNPQATIAHGYVPPRDERRHWSESTTSTTQWDAPFCEDRVPIGSPTPVPQRAATHQVYEDPIVYNQVTPAGRDHDVYQNAPRCTGDAPNSRTRGAPTAMDPIVPIGGVTCQQRHFKGYRAGPGMGGMVPDARVAGTPPSAPAAHPADPPPIDPAYSMPAAGAPSVRPNSALPDQREIRGIMTEIRDERSQSTTGEASLGVMAFWARGAKSDPYPCADPASGLTGSQSKAAAAQIPAWLAAQRPDYASARDGAQAQTEGVLHRYMHWQDIRVLCSSAYAWLPLNASPSVLRVQCLTDWSYRVRSVFIEAGSLYSGRAMTRMVRNFDYDGNGSISAPEFREGLTHYGVSMSEEEYSSVLALFDHDRSNTIDLREFMSTLRGSMTQGGFKAVQDVFTEMDTDNSNELDLNEVTACYEPRGCADVMKGTLTRDQALEQFFSNMDADKNGKVTKSEFLDFWSDVSLTFDNEQEFLKHFRGCWRRRR